MNKDINTSEEQLNAFVDGELEAEERNGLFAEAEKSADLDQRICQHRKLKELIKHAYRDVPEPKRRLPGGRTRNSMLNLAIAASLALVLGLTAGMFLRGFLPSVSSPEELAGSGSQLAAAVTENYILHVASGQPEQMKLALQTANDLLSSADPDRPRRVEVVANEQGINLLRTDVTPYSEEISALAAKNVVFYACTKTIQRLEMRGIEVQLVPEAIPGYTALDRVVIRMKDGWQYIKI